MELESNMEFAHFHILSNLDLEGEVFKAYDKKNNRFVAIHLLTTHSNLKSEIDELQHSLLMQHPSSMRIFESGSVQGRSYVATELPRGLSLKERLLQKKVPFFFSIEILRQLLESVQFGLKHHIAQREIRPSTIYLGISPKYDLQVKIVADLERFSSKESHISVSTDFNSVLKYVAPEIIQKGVPAENSIVFSLGVIAYQLFSDQDPFDTGVSSQIYTLLQNELPSVQTLIPEYDAPVNALLKKMLQKNSESRFSISEVLTFISESFLKSRTVQAKLIPRVYLEVLDNGRKFTHPLFFGQKQPITMGRSDRCDLCLDNVKASRIHARIESLYEDDFQAFDQESRNGIRVNGIRVKQHLLKDKDEIDISKITEITFRRIFQEFIYFKGDIAGESEFQKALELLKQTPPVTDRLKPSADIFEEDSSLPTLELTRSEMKSIGVDVTSEFTITARIEFNWGYLAEKLQLSNSNVVREILSNQLENLVRTSGTERVVLISYNNEILQCEICRKRDKTEARLDELFTLREDLIHKVFQTGLPVLTSIAANTPSVISLLIFPLASQRVTHAVLYLDNIGSLRGLSSYEISYAELTSGFISNLLEKSTLDQKLTEAKKEILKLQGPKETFQLKENQLTWLPASIPTHKEIELDGERLVYETQERIFYDFIYDSEEEPVFVLLGKQKENLVYAGVLRLIFRTIIHSMADFPSLYIIINCLNEALMREIGNNIRISLLLFRWDPLNTVLNYIACGNHYFTVLREGQKEPILVKTDTPFLGTNQLGTSSHQETIKLE
ncbi:MAG: FHA domain-containing protein, partial [Planctomycetota bacterium]